MKIARPNIHLVDAPESPRDASPGVLSASALAKRLSVKTSTLGRWRRLGKGPDGWYHQSTTRVVYPVAEVECFEAECKAARPSFPNPAFLVRPNVARKGRAA